MQPEFGGLVEGDAQRSARFQRMALWPETDPGLATPYHGDLQRWLDAGANHQIRPLADAVEAHEQSRLRFL
nr:hypothetical protein BOH68_09255 [Cobetia sp. MM1IDA2H-1]